MRTDNANASSTSGTEAARPADGGDIHRALVEDSPAMLWMGDETGKCAFLNRAQRDFWGVDPEDLSLFDWNSTVHPDDVATLSVPFGEAMSQHKAFAVEARYRRADGEYRTLRTEARPRFAADGTFLGMTGVNTDITGQLRAEERTRMLMGELNHRTKNILAVVQAVARQTARNSSPEDFNAAFDSRLQGLAACNDLLLQNNWSGVDLADLVASQLRYLGDTAGGRLTTSGPSVRIVSAAAQTLGMALHELSTNSLKYGAMKTPGGRVDLTWSWTVDQPLRMAWVERGVGPLSRPERKGFGHSVIVDMVQSATDADVSVEFGDDGFSWRMTTRSNTALS